MNDNLDQLLKNLRLKRMRDIIDQQLEQATKAQLSYADFLAQLLREEFYYRQAQSLQYRIKKARMPEIWTLETFPFELQPGVRASTIRQLAELDFIPRAQNIVFIGGPGVGKTGLASSILLKAIENGFRGLFIRAQDLFDDMYASLADRSTRSLLRNLANIDILLVDEMGYLNLKPEQSNIFFKLMEERYRRKSTVITTNLDFDEWYGFLGNKKMVAALLDRLRHYCITVKIDGPSLRSTSTPAKYKQKNKDEKKQEDKK